MEKKRPKQIQWSKKTGKTSKASEQRSNGTAADGKTNQAKSSASPKESEKNLLQQIKEKLGKSSDVVYEQLSTEKKRMNLLYIKPLCDDTKLSRSILTPFFETGTEEEFRRALRSLPNTSPYEDEKNAIEKLLNGHVLIELNREHYMVDIRFTSKSVIQPTQIETVIQGPQNAFTESIMTNIYLVRNRYHQQGLRVELKEVGKYTKTNVALLYDERFVDEKVLERMEEDLKNLKVDALLAAGQLETHFTRRKYSLFPTYMITERPDRVVYNLLKGKVALLIDGTEFCLIAPAVFYDFFTSMEDEYQTFWISHFLLLLRYLGVLITLLLPALYVSLISYNPGFFQVQLTLAIAGSRAPVPFASVFEVLFMILLMEMIVEASIRLPKSISATATTVGGLILGQAATTAGLVSDIMIIVVSAVAISNFVIPINTMMFAIRVIKYPIVILAAFFGTIGVVVGFFAVVFYLSNLESFGRPYFKLFIGPEAKKKEQAKPTYGI
ncbi:Spore germination protein [[Clostridium] ultunense Esp]|nr:Spore germination protein [[Clostridium] ultunense Esp]